MKTTYMGLQYELLSLEDAVEEFDRYEAKGVHKVIMDVSKGYIILDDALIQVRHTMDVLKSQGMTDAEAIVCLEGIKKGVQAFREGRIRPWSEIKAELNL